MTVKELMEFLESYPEDMQIEIATKKEFYTEVRPLQLQDFADRNYDGTDTIIIMPSYLYPYE